MRTTIKADGGGKMAIFAYDIISSKYARKY